MEIFAIVKSSYLLTLSTTKFIQQTMNTPKYLFAFASKLFKKVKKFLKKWFLTLATESRIIDY